MSRLSRRRSLGLAATTLAVLAVPAAAQAATYRVAAGEGTCDAADLTCESLTAAAAAVNAGSGGDTINIGPGTYTESPTFSVAGLTITGSTAGPVVVAGTINFTGGGAPNVLEKVAILISEGTGPGVNVGSASGGVALRDALVFSAGGAGMAIAGGAGNAITRSTVITNGAAANAVDIVVNASPTTLVADSSILSGGGTGAGISAKTGVGSLPESDRPVTITGRQITIAGSATAVLLNSSAAAGAPLGAGVGSITATFTDSIVLGAVSLTRNPGIAPLLPANDATANFTNTDRTTPAEQLFVNPAKKNFHLRAGATAIDKVPTASSTSATDVDGQARTNGVASDLGGDEFVAGPPPPAPPATARANDGTPPAIAVTTPRANQKIKLSRTRTRTVTRNGRKVTRRTTTRLTRLRIAGTAKDPSGVKGVIVTIQKLGTAAGAKCKWFNASKGIVLRSCTKPPLLLARLAADGTWVYNADARKLSAGKYRIIVLGGDNSGSIGNSASPGDAIRRFELTKK